MKKTKKVYLCTECHKRPQAPLGWFMCWECEALWHAQRTLLAAEEMRQRGEELLANARALLAAAEEREAARV
jgi:predicted ATP-dependent serine protease